ncbi:MAG: YmdB family metallophosphoesterase [Candidatus Kerfeldbacteria bacterium]|nr:YmdB family metallophosphoesterase [Candidatus Kerfeldbacteria bacterium]
MHILFLGDIVGKPGRRAVAALLPNLRQELAVDLVIANTENTAHGKGLTASTWTELRQAGVDIGTGGNHTFSKPEATTIYGQATEPLVRPLNLPGAPGQGEKTFQVGQKSVTVVNLLGQFGMNLPDVENPFVTIQRWWREHRPADVIVVDMHAEATSEKINLGWYLDGKVTAVIGTHTHVATVDARLLPNGTGYITDVGMVGLRDSSLGVDKDLALQRFLTGQKASNDIPETGLVGFNAVLFESTAPGRCTTFERIYREYIVT